MPMPVPPASLREPVLPWPRRSDDADSGGNVSGAQVSLTAAGAAGGIAVDAADAEAADRRPPGRQAESAGVAGIREAVGPALPGPGATRAGIPIGGTTRPASPLRLRLLVDVHIANTNIGRTELPRRHVTGPDFFTNTTKHCTASRAPSRGLGLWYLYLQNGSAPNETKPEQKKGDGQQSAVSSQQQENRMRLTSQRNKYVRQFYV